MTNPIANRYDFVLLFDVNNGNPNGDPDSGNMPRTDLDGHGIVTDVCLKRKIRDFVEVLERDGCGIFIRRKTPLNHLLKEACDANGQPSYVKKDGSYDTSKSKARSQIEIAELQKWLCEKYYDVRAFGAVMSTGPNAGQIRGPVQMTFARSIDPVTPMELTITRVTDVDKEEGEMGRKHVIPYALYRCHGFVSAPLARATGFSEMDLEILWRSLETMFENDRSSARGEMTTRRIVAFKHDSPLGNMHAHRLFESVVVERSGMDPTLGYGDYNVHIDEGALKPGVSIRDFTP